MASSHLSLRRWFRYYNKKYWNNELPDDTVLLWAPLTDAHGEARVKEIRLDPGLQLFPKFMRIILLHEMAHLRNLRWHHGKKFQNEIDRLYAAGAFRGLI
jgi:hypothetical protein